MRQGMDEAGASSSLAFIVAGAMFIAAVGVLLATANDKVPPEGAAGDAGYRREAQAVLDLLAESPGLGWDETEENWTKTEDLASGDYLHRGYRPALVTPGGELDAGTASSSPAYAGGKLGTWATRCAGIPLTPSSPYNLGSSSAEDEEFTCVGYDQVRELFGLGDLGFNFSLRLISEPAVPLTYPLDMDFGPPLPQTSGPSSGGAASATLRLYDTRDPTTPQLLTYELTVFVFLQCDPQIPCDAP